MRGTVNSGPVRMQSTELRVPADIHPDVLDKNTHERAWNALSDNWSGLNTLVEVAKKTKGDAALWEDAVKFAELRIMGLGNAIHDLERQMANEKGKIEQALKPKYDAAMQREIREFLAAKKLPITAALAEVRAGHVDVVSALLNAPPFLTGLDEVQRTELRNFAEHVFAPESVAALASHQKAHAALSRGVEVMTDTMNHIKMQWMPHNAEHERLRPKVQENA